MINDITDSNFEMETANGVVLIDFWAAWCGPCKIQEPVLEQLSEELDGKVSFKKMNVDENTTPSQFKIMSIPTLMIKKDGEVVETLVGVTTADNLKSVLDRYI